MGGDRAHQRRAIGVQNNQISKFGNVLAAAIRDGRVEEITAERFDDLVLALQGIERQLIAQSAAESGGDDAVLAEVRVLIAKARAA